MVERLVNVHKLIIGINSSTLESINEIEDSFLEFKFHFSSSEAFTTSFFNTRSHVNRRGFKAEVNVIIPEVLFDGMVDFEGAPNGFLEDIRSGSSEDTDEGVSHHVHVSAERFLVDVVILIIIIEHVIKENSLGIILDIQVDVMRENISMSVEGVSHVQDFKSMQQSDRYSPNVRHARVLLSQGLTLEAFSIKSSTFRQRENIDVVSFQIAVVRDSQAPGHSKIIENGFILFIIDRLVIHHGFIVQSVVDNLVVLAVIY